MQSSPSQSRSSQRPTVTTTANSAAGIGGTMSSQASGPRSSSASVRSQSSKSGLPDKQLSQIEKSVTHLLVATKQLLETLTQWSRKQATENEVSDVYVRLGYEFNLACRAFGAIGVDTADLGPVPDLLRTILEDTLSQDASPQSLDRYLPRIRDIIINLLHGLKKKQARLRSRQQREESKSLPGRQASAGSVGTSSDQGSVGNPDDNASTPQSPQKRPGARRYGSSGSLEDPPVPRDRAAGSFSDREASRREAQRALTSSTGSSSTMSADTAQSLPVQYPYTEAQPSTSTKTPPANDLLSIYPAPPPPPKQDDALGALQRSGELERRASRRFSAYQIQKHLGTSTNGVPVLPSQNTPLPNRGRDVRESLNAVRLRGSYANGKTRPTGRQESSPSRSQQTPSSTTTVTETIDRRAKPKVEPPPEATTEDSPTTKTPEDKLRPVIELDGRVMPTSAPDLPPPTEATLAEPFEPSKTMGTDGAATISPTLARRDLSNTGTSTPTTTQFIPEVSPSPGKELTLFLQYKSKIKKFVLPEGSTGLTIGRLQLAFIEKFTWNTQQNGVDLPEIYIQDPISGVRHELEDLADVKDRSVLVLNVEPLDEVKRHFDESVGSLRNLIVGVKSSIDGQETVMQRVSERQIEAAKEMARLAAAPPAAMATPSSKPKLTRQGSGFSAASVNQVSEVQSLRRDLAVLRQTYSNFTSDIAASMTKIRAKAGTVKTAADNVATPSYDGDAGRARISAGKKELADESERLVGRVDDLQDLVEDLRKDVVSRGVRPLPRQLEGVSKDLSAVTNEVRKMREFLKTEKPIWTKIWEKELQLVCEERDQLTMQEDLAADLEDDLEKAAQTFALVEQATKQQNVQSPTGAPVLRSISRTLAVDPGVDPMKAKDDMLGEVRALQPNHESRLEAIERAERARRKELETRRGDLFQKELGQFVQEGKLKKSGGHEEADRMRRAKDDRIRREVWERQQARAAELEREAAAEGETPANNENSATEETGNQSEEAETEEKPRLTQDTEIPESEGSADHDTTTSPESNSKDGSDQTSASSPVSPSKRTSWLPSIFSG